MVRAGQLLAREGVVVPERTLHRYALDVLGHGPAKPAHRPKLAPKNLDNRVKPAQNCSSAGRVRS